MQPDGIARLRLLVDSARLPVIAAARDREVAPLQPGQAVEAKVEQQTASGYLVSVRGRTYEFTLADEASPGDTLKLVYVDDQPRPTFALLKIERGATPGEAALSNAGKLLSALRDPGTAEQSRVTMRAGAPIFAGTPPAAPQAAATLRQALSLCGLFYESHQAQWAMGARSMAQLRQEPQGRLPPLPQPAGATASFVKVSPPDAVATGDAPFKSAAPAHADAEPARPAMPVHPDTFPIVREQLSVLESGQIIWRGEAWPGQPMDWEVGEQADAERSCGEADRCWSTSLALHLPHVGNVEARIDLRAGIANLRITADSPEHARLLLAHSAELSAGFEAAGVALAGLAVHHESAAP
jgi:hypothetical protein